MTDSRPFRVVPPTCASAALPSPRTAMRSPCCNCRSPLRHTRSLTATLPAAISCPAGPRASEKADPAKPGYAFVTALAKLMERTGMDKLAMSDFNINKDDLPKVAHIAAAEVGFECDRYTVTEADVVEILMQSYK